VARWDRTLPDCLTYQGVVSNLGQMERPPVNHERLEVVTISPGNL